MAKTFKSLTPPASAPAPAKPVSERDFFDLTDEPVLEVTSKKQVSKLDNTNNTGNTIKTAGRNSAGNTSNTDSAPVLTPVAKLEETEDRDLRQTFVVSSRQLEQLRDHVHARRAKGDYEYSQKQALQEALALLFASVPQAAPRPSQTRELEQQRRERIRRGRTR
jgi:hypothetical protein